MEPFQIHVSQRTLDDLHHRLDTAILPVATPGPEWSRGMPPHVLADLIAYWREQYDWRAQERRLNAYEQFMVELDGCKVHVLRRRGRQPGRLPVILTHGWPYTFAEMLPTLEAIGGELDVIVPSLPGYVFSEPLPVPFSDEAIADRWHHLMTNVLGYERFLTYGEDVGTGVNDWLAGKYPEAVGGIVASHASFSARTRADVELTGEEQAFFAGLNDPSESGYAHQQGTRPDTLAAGLTDSPSGLLAWIAEKFASWSGSEGLDQIATDDVLTAVMLYWTTSSIGTSFRSYCEADHAYDHPLIRVPASLVIQTREAGYPRSLGEKSYLDIRSFRVLERGGHFPAWKAPDDIAEAILDLERQVRSVP